MINTVTKKKIFLETYGCQMNEYDTELVKAILAKKEYVLTTDELQADIVMLNTCAIRENAHRKVYGRVHEIRHKRRKKIEERRGRIENRREKIEDGQKTSTLHHPSSNLNEQGEARQGMIKDGWEKIEDGQKTFTLQPPSSIVNNKPVIIGLLGCMATNLRTELLEDKNLQVDFIAGPDSYKRLPEIIEQASGGEKAFDLTLSEFETYSDIFPTPAGGVGAFISVQRGCNNFCTFCVVPYTRGRERSRSIKNVVEEAGHLAAQGFRQVTLLGQNVNSYQHESGDFADLMEAVAKVDGIERVRFTSPHPKDFPDKFLQVMQRNKKICKQIHLPLQAGSSRVLEMMNRTYTREEFLALVEKIRQTIPDVCLSTDIIVGFPTETDAEFAETLEVMKAVEFDSAFMFKYSERKGTIAQRKLPDDVPEAKKTERIVRLNELQSNISLKRNEAHIGRELEVLIEKKGSHRSDDDYIGRTDGNKLVTLRADRALRPGELILAKITQATPHALRATCDR